MAENPAFADAIELSQDFAQLLRERTPEQFDGWLGKALSSQLPSLVTFAEGLQLDYDALSLPQ